MWPLVLPCDGQLGVLTFVPGPYAAQACLILSLLFQYASASWSMARDPMYVSCFFFTRADSPEHGRQLSRPILNDGGRI